MRSSEWLDLLKQIPFHEVEARRIIGDRVAQDQCMQLIELLESDRICSLAGLLERPTGPSTTDSPAPRG